MQQSDANTTSVNSASFATLLASLAAPAKKPSSGWSNEGLEDDVATLSYEHALRAHARYRPETTPATLDDQSLTQAPDPVSSYQRTAEPQVSTTTEEARPAYAGSPAFNPAAAESSFGKSHSYGGSRRMATRMERNLLRASVTIRMSEAECEQLHRRAAEAGVTVSSYLRSCTFEAEALRAQVKETLAQLRAVTQPMKTAAVPAERASRPGFWRRLWIRLWRKGPHTGDVPDESGSGRRMARA
jgi:hypothetical protein